MKRFLSLLLTCGVFVVFSANSFAQDAFTRNLILTGDNAYAMRSTLQPVTGLTAQRTWQLPNLDGYVVLSPSASLTANRVAVINASGLLTTVDMPNGNLLMGSGGAYAVAAPTGTRGLVVTTGAGTLDLALPSGATDNSLRFDGTNWVANTGLLIDASGDLSAPAAANLGITVSGGGNLVLGGIVVDATPTQMLTLTGGNAVRFTTLSSTADQGVIFTSGQYLLGGTLATHVPFLVSRFVNLNTSDLTFTVNGGAGNLLFLDGDAANAAVTINSFGTGDVTISAADDANIGGADLILSGSATGSLNSPTLSINTTGGNNTTLGNTTGTLAIASSTGLNVNTAGVISDGNGAVLITDSDGLTVDVSGGANTGNVTMTVGTAGDLILNNVDAVAPIEDILWINGSNQVRRSPFAGTANEGVQFQTSAYRLGVAASTDATPWNDNPFLENRYVNLNTSGLFFTTNNANTSLLTLTGDAANGAVTINSFGTGDVTISAADDANIGGADLILSGSATGSLNSPTLSINTTGGNNTTLGNTTGTLAIASSTGLNVNTAGVISDGDGNVIVADHLVPSDDNSYDLGTDALRWRSLYVHGTSLHVGPTGGAGSNTELAIGYNDGTNTTASFNVNGSGVELTLTTTTLTANTSVVVNSAGGNDLTITEDAITRDGGIAINPGAANSVTTNGRMDITGTLTVGQGLTLPVLVNVAGAVAVGAGHYVVIQEAVADVDLPAGTAGRTLIVKNRSGWLIDINSNGADTFEGGGAALTIGDGVSVQLIFSGTIWYQVGN